MISTFNNMVEQIKKLIHDKEQVEKEKYQEELHTLQSQMNPHFLMNTLNTLKFMAISAHYTGMQDMVVALENILAAVLNRDGGFYTVRDEQSVLESYIYIMQFRYMDSFEVDINLSPGILDCKVRPPGKDNRHRNHSGRKPDLRDYRQRQRHGSGHRPTNPWISASSGISGTHKKTGKHGHCRLFERPGITPMRGHSRQHGTRTPPDHRREQHGQAPEA